MAAMHALAIDVHLEDGCITKFVQDDPSMAQAVLESIQPNRLFSAPQLLIGSEHMVTAFQPSRIVRVDVMTSLAPNWPSPTGALDTREITEDQFRNRRDPSSDVQRLPSMEMVAFGEWEMVNGARIFLQTHLTGFEEKQLPVELSMRLQKVMTSGGLLVRGRSGGYVILNPASLVRYTSYLGLQELPPNALPMMRLPE